MAQHTIGISEEAFNLFQQTKHRLNARGFAFSSARCLLYLIEFEREIVKAFDLAVNAQTAQEGYDHLKNAVDTQMGYHPPVIPRKNYKRSRYASIEMRVYVIKQIQDRLHIKDPPFDLVNYYLDHGFEDQVMREHVLKSKGLQDEPPSDTPAQP